MPFGEPAKYKEIAATVKAGKDKISRAPVYSYPVRRTASASRGAKKGEVLDLATKNLKSSPFASVQSMAFTMAV